MTVYLGTSGWQYRDWRGRFYPEGLALKSWLEFYAERFRCVESNNAFYRLPERKTFEDWARRTPDDFVWAVKMSRYLTHIKRLKDPAEPVTRFLNHARGLGKKLGPVLIQLPPNLKADIALLERALKRFRGRERISVEFRHESWFVDPVRALLEERGVALCLADRGSRPIAPLWRTADWGYVRLHQGAGTPHPCYGRGSLESWAQRIGDLWGAGADVFVFFNNDTLGCALRDARVFQRALDRAGLGPTRAPRETVRAG